MAKESFEICSGEGQLRLHRQGPGKKLAVAAVVFLVVACGAMGIFLRGSEAAGGGTQSGEASKGAADGEQATKAGDKAAGNNRPPAHHDDYNEAAEPDTGTARAEAADSTATEEAAAASNQPAATAPVTWWKKLTQWTTRSSFSDEQREAWKKLTRWGSTSMPNSEYNNDKDWWLLQDQTIVLKEELDLTEIRALKISGGDVDHLDALVTLMPAMVNLKGLIIWLISHNCPNSQSFAQFADALQQVPGLEHFQLENGCGEMIGDAGMNPLAKSLHKMKGMKRLGLEKMKSPDGAEALAAALKSMPRLEQLLLANTHIGESAALALAKALPSTMRILDLQNTHIGDVGAAALGTSLQAEEMIELKLSTNQIGDIGLEKLLPALKKMTKLQILELKENNIGDAGALELSEVLRKMPELTTLNLAINHIGDRGAEELAKKLKGMEDEQRMTDQDAKGESRSSDKILTLHDNELSDDKRKELAKILPNWEMMNF